jgi:peptidoglycan DL-endopeptidase CwlO
VSVGAVVERVGEVLGRAHALFGDPAESGRSSAARAGTQLADAGESVHGAQRRIEPLSGDFATGYGAFAGRTGSALDGFADADNRFSGQLGEAVGSDRAGRAASGSVVNGAVADTAGLGPLSRTLAGERALIAALRSRVAQQQRVIAAYRARDARMAAVLRSLAYARGGSMSGGYGIPSGGGGFAATGHGGFTGVPAPHGMAERDRNPRIVTVANRRPNPSGLPDGPGAVAARAALSRRGSPYVWGAKGPWAFDCSGLTQWSWEQAGVRLGGDTYSQINEGIAVPAGQVRAGDLIFPAASFGEDGRSGPGHVQLAISPTEVIHAPQTGDFVRLAPMPSSFVARRPVPADYGEN